MGSSTARRRDRGDLDDDTNDHNKGTKEDTLAATKLVTKDEDETGTKETADSVDGNDETFVGRITVDLRESLDESRGRDDTTHDTLVVTEEKEVCDGNNGDEDLKHPSGLAPVGRNAMFTLIDSWRHDCSVSMVGGKEKRGDAGGEGKLGERVW